MLKQKYQKKQILTLLFIITAVFAIVPQQAQAGIFGWLDEATTYHEDQKRPFKQEIIPSGPPAPLMYDSQDADSWTRYYTRDDLVPVAYMNGSGSMVMRPHQAQPSMQQDMLHGYVLDRNGNPIIGPDGQPITGYDVMARRAALNKAQQGGRLFIGNPDDNNMPQYGDRDLGVKTRIGSPRQDWRDTGQGRHFNPQRGDYDYVENQRGNELDIYTSPPAGGSTIARNGGVGMAPNRRSGDNAFPDNYTVVDGDTLSEISEQDRIYGDWKLWPLIYDANRSQISNPDLIYPDQNLGIPRDYTFDQADSARSRSLPPYDR